MRQADFQVILLLSLCQSNYFDGTFKKNKKQKKRTYTVSVAICLMLLLFRLVCEGKLQK